MEGFENLNDLGEFTRKFNQFVDENRSRGKDAEPKGISCIIEYLQCVVYHASNASEGKSRKFLKYFLNISKAINELGIHVHIFDRYSKTLLEIVLELLIDRKALISKEVLYIYSTCLMHISKQTRMDKSKELYYYLGRIMDSLSSCDYELQSLILESLLRLCQNNAKDLISQQCIIFNEKIHERYFLRIKRNKFDVHVREFLNVFNESTKCVVSILCSRISLDDKKLEPPSGMECFNGLWVDFNLVVRSISFSFNNAEANEDEQKKGKWDRVVIMADGISSIEVSPEKNERFVTIKISFHNHLKYKTVVLDTDQVEKVQGINFNKFKLEMIDTNHPVKKVYKRSTASSNRSELSVNSISENSNMESLILRCDSDANSPRISLEEEMRFNFEDSKTLSNSKPWDPTLYSEGNTLPSRKRSVSVIEISDDDTKGFSCVMFSSKPYSSVLPTASQNISKYSQSPQQSPNTRKRVQNRESLDLFESVNGSDSENSNSSIAKQRNVLILENLKIVSPSDKIGGVDFVKAREQDDSNNKMCGEKYNPENHDSSDTGSIDHSFVGENFEKSKRNERESEMETSNKERESRERMKSVNSHPENDRSDTSSVDFMDGLAELQKKYSNTNNEMSQQSTPLGTKEVDEVLKELENDENPPGNERSLEKQLDLTSRNSDENSSEKSVKSADTTFKKHEGSVEKFAEKNIKSDKTNFKKLTDSKTGNGDEKKNKPIKNISKIRFGLKRKRNLLEMKPIIEDDEKSEQDQKLRRSSRTKKTKQSKIESQKKLGSSMKILKKVKENVKQKKESTKIRRRIMRMETDSSANEDEEINLVPTKISKIEENQNPSMAKKEEKMKTRQRVTRKRTNSSSNEDKESSPKTKGNVCSTLKISEKNEKKQKRSKNRRENSQKVMPSSQVTNEESNSLNKKATVQCSKVTETLKDPDRMEIEETISQQSSKIDRTKNASKKSVPVDEKKDGKVSSKNLHELEDDLEDSVNLSMHSLESHTFNKLPLYSIAAEESDDAMEDIKLTQTPNRSSKRKPVTELFNKNDETINLFQGTKLSNEIPEPSSVMDANTEAVMRISDSAYNQNHKSDDQAIKKRTRNIPEKCQNEQNKKEKNRFLSEIFASDEDGMDDIETGEKEDLFSALKKSDSSKNLESKAQELGKTAASVRNKEVSVLSQSTTKSLRKLYDPENIEIMQDTEKVHKELNEIESSAKSSEKKNVTKQVAEKKRKKLTTPMKKTKQSNVVNAHVITTSFANLIREEGARNAADINTSPELNREIVEENQFVNINDRMTNKFMRFVGRWLSKMYKGESLSDEVRKNARAMIHVAKKVPREIEKR